MLCAPYYFPCEEKNVIDREYKGRIAYMAYIAYRKNLVGIAYIDYRPPLPPTAMNFPLFLYDCSTTAAASTSILEMPQ
jgi:hypothetical protein